MNKFYIFFLCASLSICSSAAEFVGKIQSIAAGPNLGGDVLVRVEGQSTTAGWSTSCSTNGYWSFKFDSSVAGGKETYSLLLTAYASKTPVVINGTGTCSDGVINNVQNLYYVRFAF